MKKVLPIFTSHFSLGKSILILEKSLTPINNNDPVSIFSIAKQHRLKEIFLVETALTGFRKAVDQAKEEGIKLNFGLKLTICDDQDDKTDESQTTESKIIVWLKEIQDDHKGYKDLINLSSISWVDGFYKKPRIDYKTLRENLTNNLFVSIPFYSSFLSCNLLQNKQCVPQFGNIPLIFHLQDMDLPFDHLIREQVKNYAKKKFDIMESHNVYYYSKEDSEAYLNRRCMANRSTFNKPQIDHFSSTDFCFERWLEKEKEQRKNT